MAAKTRKKQQSETDGTLRLSALESNGGGSASGSASSGNTNASVKSTGTSSAGTAPSGKTGESGYAAWLAAYGTDAGAAYDASVREAERTYDRAGSGYGAQGEALGRAELTGSGYGDYLDGVAYAAKIRAQESAAEKRLEADKANRAGYAAYLTEQAERAQSTLNAIRLQKITDESIAYEYARTCGMGDEDARTISRLVGQMNTGEETSTSAVRQRVTIMQYMVSMEFTRDAAYAYALSCGVGERLARQMAEATESAVAAKNQNKIHYY